MSDEKDKMTRMIHDDHSFVADSFKVALGVTILGARHCSHEAKKMDTYVRLVS